MSVKNNESNILHSQNDVCQDVDGMLLVHEVSKEI